jgi:hypothetical protein
MSIEVMTHVWKHSKHKGSCLLVLLAIADHCHDDGAGAFPSVWALAKKIRMKVRNTQIIIHRLEASGELRVDYQAGPNGVNMYRIPLEMGGANFAPLQQDAPGGMQANTPGGAKDDTHGVQGNAPIIIMEPSINHQGEPSMGVLFSSAELNGKKKKEKTSKPGRVLFAGQWTPTIKRGNRTFRTWPQYESRIKDICDKWSVYTKQPGAHLNDERRSNIGDRLAEGYTEKYIIEACKGIMLREFNVENGHIDIELICRSAGHVDKYHHSFANPPTAGNGNGKKSAEVRQKEILDGHYAWLESRREKKA